MYPRQELRYDDPHSYRERRNDLLPIIAPPSSSTGFDAPRPYFPAEFPHGRGAYNRDRHQGFGRGRGRGFDSGRGRGGRSNDNLDNVVIPRQDFRDLPPFEKNFYFEHPAVQAMSEADVMIYRRRRDITIEGRDVPKPVRAFAEANFPGIVLKFFSRKELPNICLARSPGSLLFILYLFPLKCVIVKIEDDR